VEHEGKGAILYMMQSNHGQGLLSKLKDLERQQTHGEQDADVSLEMDHRDYGIG
jgi:3,4-dihydroxy 2-butanone 4-phosphate synthase/GTP cyclohydrolase II